MKNFFKKISILLCITMLPTIIIASKTASKPVSKNTTAETTNKPSLSIQLQQQYGKLKTYLTPAQKTTATYQTANKQSSSSSTATSSPTNQLTTSQKLAIQTRNALSKTGISNKGWIDGMAGTKEYAQSNGTKFTNGVQSTATNPMYQKNYANISVDIGTSELGNKGLSLTKSPNSSQRPISGEFSSFLEAPKNQTKTPTSISQSTINPMQTKTTSHTRTSSIQLNSQNNQQPQNSSKMRPAETNLINKNGNNQTKTPYREFLTNITYQELKSNMINPTKNGYQSKTQVAQDFVAKLLVESGMPDAFFSSKDYMNQSYKLMVKKFYDAMNKARTLTSPKDRAAAEQIAQKEVTNPLISQSQTYSTHQADPTTPKKNNIIDASSLKTIDLSTPTSPKPKAFKDLSRSEKDSLVKNSVLRKQQSKNSNPIIPFRIINETNAV